MRVLVVSSVGGHLTEVMQLAPLFEGHEVSLVVNDRADLPSYPFKDVFQVVHAERDWRVAFNLLEAARIVEAVRPQLIVSMGAGPAVPFALVGKLYGARVLFVESAAAVSKPTLTGRLMYRIADRFFYQWSGVADCFPRGRKVSVLFP